MRSRLAALGAWDPFNVTEDADLGLRIARAGLRTAMLDSTTHEEAASHLGSWVRQRSRWMKGWMQTWLVHTRGPRAGLRELGPLGTLHCQLLLAGTFVPLLLGPLVATAAFAWALGAGGGALGAAAAGAWAISSAAMVMRYALGLRGRARGRALLAPAYALLMSAATWRALQQLVRRPSHWEKTPHGLAPPLAAAEPSRL
jgi:hypothetical protein